MSREQAYGALSAKLQQLETSGVLTTYSRKIQPIEKVDDVSMPAGFLSVGDQETSRQDKLPAKRTWDALFTAYLSTPDDNTPPGPAINNLIEQVEALLEPAPGFATQTLGGVVQHCWIEGRTEVFEAILGTKSAFVIPIRMLVP